MALILLKIIANIMYMGNFFTSNNSEIIFLKVSDNYKEVLNVENIDENDYRKKYLEKRNIRSIPILTKYQKYAPDIKINYDYNNIKKDINNFNLKSSESGFTSIVNVYEYKNFKIIEKLYKSVDKNSNWYVNDEFIKESFYNELSTLILLKEEEIFPKILFYDEEEMKIIMTYKGEKISDKNNNIDLSKIPKDWKLQLYHILQILKKYNLYHNDITCRNLCMKDNKFYLIDFGNCKNYIDLYYRNYYTDLILNSENIIEFFNKVDSNAIEIRKCQMEH